MRIKPTLLYTTALSLAAVGAAVSLSGLVTMFGIAFLPVGAGLEVGKLTGATALHRHWGTLSRGVRCTLTAVVGTLMVLTSAGVYGFAYQHYLSHVAAATAPAMEQAAAVDAAITRQTERVADVTMRMKALDGATTMDIATGAKPKTAAAIAAQARALVEGAKLRMAEEGRRRAERALLTAERDTEAGKLAALQEDRAKAASAELAAAAQVGPVRVVAEALGVDPGKVVAATVAAIYDLLCILLLLVAGHERAKSMPMPMPVVAKKKRTRSEAARLGWERRKFKALGDTRKRGPTLVKS